MDSGDHLQQLELLLILIDVGYSGNYSKTCSACFLAIAHTITSGSQPADIFLHPGVIAGTGEHIMIGLFYHFNYASTTFSHCHNCWDLTTDCDCDYCSSFYLSNFQEKASKSCSKVTITT